MDSLIENLLKVKTTGYRKIREEISRNFEGDWDRREEKLRPH